MTTRQTTNRTSTTIRLLHASFPVGIVLFAAVVHFFVRPAMGETLLMPPVVTGVLLAISLGASALSLVLRRRVPLRNTNESADLYWTTATVPALLTWMPLEIGGLLGVVAYMLSGAPAALVAAGVALAGFVALNPARLERA